MTFFELVIAIVGLGILCGMYESFLKHRREMAKILHKGTGKADGRIEALEKKVAELTEIVHDQTFVIENLNSRLAVPKEIEERLRA
ncbi:hypothetical protein EON82_07380 [bacterium]|nr:MAG: hypothetical protein EON82_07380 [bacterium]